ncbi:MAG: hypothetical protein JWN48_4216 [Myxococcaceae bacterium]|nr:hypothetical protein [Myxococcaceae bacterium]
MRRWLHVLSMTAGLLGCELEPHSLGLELAGDAGSLDGGIMFEQGQFSCADSGPMIEPLSREQMQLCSQHPLLPGCPLRLYIECKKGLLPDGASLDLTPYERL